MNLSTRAIATLVIVTNVLTVAFGTTESGAVQPRISTGQDLYEACKTLANFALKPEGPTPRKGLYCRQYLAGYFATLKYVHDDDNAKAALGMPLYAPDCIDITGPRSYEQLAARVIHSAEWHPELLGQPALQLVHVAFGSSPSCAK